MARRQQPTPAAAHSARFRRALLLPLGFVALLAAFLALPAVRAEAALQWSFAGAAGALLVWWGVLAVASRGRALRAKWVLRRPHWLQPLVQGSVYAYWATTWPPVVAFAWMIAAQLVFAYAFDLLLGWSRRDEIEVGMGQFPIILSINLFLWFKPEWFNLQFVLVASGFLAKEFLRWQKDGRSAHIFNPSSFPLAIMSAFLIATGTTNHTFGIEIAHTLGNPRHIFEFLFLVSLPGQILFGVASMTMPAVITAWLCGVVYFAFTHSYYYFGPIPPAAFLGMLLLFTDPATAPKSELGRVIYGVLYGLSVFTLYGLLDLTGNAEFYDKLLFVPFLNLAVRALDVLAARPLLRRIDPARLWPKLQGRARNLALTATWTAAFLALVSVEALGDAHPANRLPFWRTACVEGRRNACRNLETMESTFCGDGSGWACNELGLRAARGPLQIHVEGDATATNLFVRSCQLGFYAGCGNLRGGRSSQPPTPEDYNVVLENKTLPHQRTAKQLFEWACAQGWSEACETLQRNGFSAAE